MKKKRRTRWLAWVMSMILTVSTVLGVGNGIVYAADNDTITGVTTHTYNGSTVGLFSIYNNGNTYTGFCSQHALSNPATGSAVTWTACTDPYVLSALYYGYGGDGGSRITDGSGNLLSADAQIVFTDLAVSYYRGLSEQGLSYDADDTPYGAYAGSKPTNWNGDYGRYVKYAHDNVDKVPIGDTFQFRKGDASGEICTTFDAQTFDEYDGICTDWIYVDAPYYSSFDITVPANVTLYWEDTTDGTSSGTISGGSTDKLWGTYKFYMQCTDDSTLESLGTWSSGTLTSSKRVYGWYAETGSTTQDLVCYTLHYPTASFNVTWPAPPPVTGSLSMTKVSSNPGLTDGNPCYSLAGAEYQVYTDAACTQKATALVLDAGGNQTGTTNALLTTNADGSANVLHMQTGGYYVKEIKSGKGYRLDSKVYPVVITNANAGTTQTFTSTEVPIGDPASVEVSKTDAEGITMIQSGTGGAVTEIGNASLEGAVFKVTYYNDYYDSNSIGSATPTRTWYIQTKYDAAEQKFKAKLNAEHLASGYTSDAFYYSNADSVIFPLGTVTYEEFKPAPGYNNVGFGSIMTDASGVLSGTKSIMQIRPDLAENPTAAYPYVESRTGSYETNAHNIPIKVFTTAAAGTDVAVQEQIVRGDMSFTKRDYEGQTGMENVFFRITSSTGESHIIKTGADGFYSSASTNTSHLTNTNGFDTLYSNLVDDDPDNDVVGGVAIEDMECGLWFYGTADKSEWNPATISDSRGALRYDDSYTIEELPCPANKGKKLVTSTFAITRSGVTDTGIYNNVWLPEIKTHAFDVDTESSRTAAITDSMKIGDIIDYKYLQPGWTYRIESEMKYQTADGRIHSILDADGNPLIGTSEVIPEELNGSHTVYLPEFDGTQLLDEDGNLITGSIVVYERIYHEDELVASEESIDAEDQTITLNRGCQVTVKKTGPFVTGSKTYEVNIGTTKETITRLVFEQQPYAGVTFTVFNAETDEAVTSFTTRKDGIGKSEFLPYDGTEYYIKETGTPAGLIQSTEQYPVTFVYDEESSSYQMAKNLTVANDVTGAKINVYKQGELIVPNTTDGYGIAQKGIAGVYFGVYTEDDITDSAGTVMVKKDTLVGVAKTNASGVASIMESLVAGDYYFKELQTATEEYVLDTTQIDFTITYKRNETKSVVEFNVNAESPVLNRYKSLPVELLKTDDGGNVLSGVEFTLYRKGPEETQYQPVGVYVTGKDGKIRIEDVPYGDYYFVETKGLEGYTFDSDKTYSFVINDTTVEKGECILLTAVNEKIPDVPQTGDTIPLVWIISILILSVLAGSICFFRWKQKNKRTGN